MNLYRILIQILLLSIFRVSLPGYESNLQAPISHSTMVKPWERFGVELVLTFVVVFAYFVSTGSYRKFLGSSAAMIGAAYGCCTFVSVSSNFFTLQLTTPLICYFPFVTVVGFEQIYNNVMKKKLN